MPLTACFGSDARNAAGDPDGTASRQPTASGFAHVAARACTAVVNDHLVPQTTPVGIDVLTAIRAEEPPTTAKIETWAQTFDAEAARMVEIRAALAAVSSNDETQQALWDAVVASGDGDLTLATERRDLLLTGDWSRISDEFPLANQTDDTAGGESHGDALDALGLAQTDCMAPYNVGRDVAKEFVDFEQQASEACLTTWSRRMAADHWDNLHASLDVLVDLKENDEVTEIPDGLEQALVGLRDEWVWTAEDLEKVTATAPAPEEWDDVLAAARERVTVYSERLDVVRAGDLDRMTEVFEPNWTYPGVDYQSAGMDRPICLGAGG